MCRLLDGTQGSADNLTEKLAKLISKKSVGDHPPVATTTQATVDSTKNAAVMSSSEKAKVLQSIFKASQQIEAVGEASVVQSHINASTTTVSRKADETKAFSSTNSSDRVVESSEKTKQLKSLLVKSSADQVAPKPPSTASSEKAPAAEPVAESKAKSLLSMLKAAPSKPIETASATNDDLLTDGEIAARKKQAVVANQSKKLIDNVVSTTVNDSVTPVNNNQKLRRVELSFSSGPKPSSTTSIDFLSEGVRKIEVSELFAKAKSVARVNEHAPVISKSEKVSAKPKLISPSDLI